MGCSQLLCTKVNNYSWSGCDSVKSDNMRFKSNKTAVTVEASKQQNVRKEVASTSASSCTNSVFSSTTKTWPSFQIPLKKQWHRRQTFMENLESSSEKVNPFLAALENTKNDSFSNCLKDLDKSSTSESFIKSNDFSAQPFSSAGLGLFLPKPKGLVDGLSRFFTPTNKRKSRVAISSLGDSISMDDGIHVTEENSFSGTVLDPTLPGKKSSSFRSLSENKCGSTLSASPSASNSSPSNSQASSSSSVVIHPVKQCGSGQLKNLFDGLSHLYTASTDSRKRSTHSPSSSSSKTLAAKRQYKKVCSATPEEKTSSRTSQLCDKIDTGDSFKVLSDNRTSKETIVESDASSSIVSSECSFNVKKPEPSPKLEGSFLGFPTIGDNRTCSQLFASVPDMTRIFGSPAVQDVEDHCLIQDEIQSNTAEPEISISINVTEEDELLFRKVQETAEQVYTPKSGLAPVARKPSLLQFGKYEISVLYTSPYPREYLRLSKLFLCEFCLKFMKTMKTLQRHLLKCKLRQPPANEIYRKGDLSVFEVDGGLNKTYCQNLCFLAKLFLDHKTLFFDVEPFLFYVLTRNDKKGCHLVGYFSKERYCQQRYNVSCVMVMPQYRRKGYGRFLIDFSYLLSKNESRFGTPEKPLSDLGRLCYTSYWESVVLWHLDTVDRSKKITIKSICKSTGMTFLDVVSTLTVLEMVIRNDLGKYIVTINESVFKPLIAKLNKKKSQQILLDPNCLQWEPKKLFKPENCKKCRKENSKLRNRKRQYLRTNSKSLEKVFVGGLWYSKERIKCETCLLTQERERRKLLKHKSKRKLLDMDSIMNESKRKKLKMASSVLDSSDDSVDYLRYTSAKIRNLKRKLLRKHKLKLQRKYQEQKQETDILKYAVLGEHKSSKIKVHSFLRKSSKVNVECQQKLKRKHIRKERCRKKNKSKNSPSGNDRRKHKVKSKKKESKLSDKEEGVHTPPVLLPAVSVYDEDSSREPDSASEQDLLPPPLLQALVETKESLKKDEVHKVSSEVSSVVSEPLANGTTLESDKSVSNDDSSMDGDSFKDHTLRSSSPETFIVTNKSEESAKHSLVSAISTEGVIEICEDTDSRDRNRAAVEPLLKDVPEHDNVLFEDDDIIEENMEHERCKLIEPNDSDIVELGDSSPGEQHLGDDCRTVIEDRCRNGEGIDIHQVPECSMNKVSIHNELKNYEEDNEVREAVEVLNEQMESVTRIDMPLTPQTPESNQSRHYSNMSPYQSHNNCKEDDGMLSSNEVEEIDDVSNSDCQITDDVSVQEINDIHECTYAHQTRKMEMHRANADRYSDEIMEQPEIIVELPQISQPMSQNSQMSSPATPMGTIVTKHTPTPQEMSSMGVYTPDSSTNSGYNSVEIDVCQLGLESPTSVCSSEIAQQNSVEARSPPSQSYSDCAQVSNSSPYCTNVSISEQCSNPSRREILAAAAAAQAAVVQAQAQAHHTNTTSHCINVSNRKRQQQQQHSAGISQRVASLPTAGPVSSLMQSSMVSVNATAVNALFVGPPNTNNGYMNAMNMSVPCSNAATGGPVAGSYMVGVPVATVIQPQSAAAFASMQNHHQLQQSSQNFAAVANHATGNISSAMQRLTHVAPNPCPSSSVTHNFHIQSPSYTYTPTPTPTPNTPSQIGTSCSLAKLQQLTNGIMDIVPTNPPCNTMTPPPNMTPPSPQVNMTPPPPQMQRSLTPAAMSLQSQLNPMQSAASHNYNKYHFHHRQMQRNATANVTLSPNLVASYQTINGVGYRIQQAPSAAMLNTAGYITNAGFINQPSAAAGIQMGMVNVNMHGQASPYQEPSRPQNAMYATYSYHISGNLQPQSLNSVMRR